MCLFRWTYYLLMSFVLFAPFVLLAIDLLYLAGVINLPDPSLAKRMRPF